MAVEGETASAPPDWYNGVKALSRAQRSGARAGARTPRALQSTLQPQLESGGDSQPATLLGELQFAQEPQL